jgi:hypothetical protein
MPASGHAEPHQAAAETPGEKRWKGTLLKGFAGRSRQWPAFIPHPGYRTDVAARAEFKRSFLQHAGKDPERNANRFDEFIRDVHGIVNESPQLPWLSNIPVQDLAAVRMYTSGFVKRLLNVPLKTLCLAENPPPEVVAAAMKELGKFLPCIRAVCSGMNALPAYGKTVFRGVNIAPEFLLRRYVEGTLVDEDFFLSTALGIERAWKGNVLFRIHSKTGRDISLLSLKPREQEVLFAPGCRFKVVRVTRNPQHADDRYTREFEVELREV